MMDRPPANMVMTQADFENCGYSEVLATAECDYFSMQTALGHAAQNKQIEKKLGESAVLYLFADLCGMMLNPASFNQPFHPSIICYADNKRSMIPDDLSVEQLAFIASVYSQIDNNLLRARLADIVYLKDRKTYKAALAAIDAYSAVELNLGNKFWLRSLDCWKRGLFLARILKGKAQERLNKLEKKIITTLFLEETPSDKPYLTARLADSLLKAELELDKITKIAHFLEDKARNFSSEENFERANHYYDSARQWYHKAKAEDDAHRVILLKAKTLEQCANFRKEDGLHNIASRHFLEQTIQEYRKLPAVYRDKNGLSNKLTELQVELAKANEETPHPMHECSTEPIDISAEQEKAEKLVVGKTRYEALLCFAELIPFEDIKKLKSNAKEQLEKNFLAYTMRNFIISSDGRVIARDNPDNNLNGQTLLLYSLRININIQAYLLPALSVLCSEHRMNQQDFYELTHNNPLIPPDKEKLAAKVLYNGYEGDFTAALYMLAPLMEAIVRFHLKMRNVPTTHLDEQGIEEEKGLSTLINEPTCKEIFGENLTEEIRLLFCDAMGANLRNNVAHGLLSDIEGTDAHSIYAWYLLFKLVFSSSEIMRDRHK